MSETAVERPSVRTPTGQWGALEKERKLPRLLASGLEAMQESSTGKDTSYPQTGLHKKSGRGFVVQHPLESDADFGTRVQLLQFDNRYWMGCENIGSMPFTEPVTWSEDTPDEVRALESNVESTSRISGVAGRDLRAFARWCCTQTTGYGMGGLYANQRPGEDRPHLSYVPGHLVIETRQRTDGDAVRLSRLRLVTYAGAGGSTEGGKDARGLPWQFATYERVMVLYDGDPTVTTPGAPGYYASYEIYDREEPGNPGSPWKLTPTVKQTPIVPQRQIPMAYHYTGYEGFWFNRPWLRQLAHLERVWMNKRSDLDYIIKTSCVPMWSWPGATKEDIERTGVIAPGNVWASQTATDHLMPAEFEGGSMKVSQDDIESLERRIDAVSLSPMLNRPDGRETATKVRVSEQRANTQAEAMTLGWADSFSQGAQFMAIFMRLPPAVVEKTYCMFHHDFGIGPRELELAKILTQAYLTDPPKIRPALWFQTMKRLGALGENVEPEDEASWVDKNTKAYLSDLIGADAADGSAPPGAPRGAAGGESGGQPSN